MKDETTDVSNFSKLNHKSIMARQQLQNSFGALGLVSARPSKTLNHKCEPSNGYGFF